MSSLAIARRDPFFHTERHMVLMPAAICCTSRTGRGGKPDGVQREGSMTNGGCSGHVYIFNLACKAGCIPLVKSQTWA